MALVEYEVKDKIAYITLNRPDRLNAVSPPMFNELVATCERYAKDSDAWVAILSGKGRAFCTGADLLEGREGRPPTDEIYFSIMSVKKPIIAAVHGYCLAQGNGIALACDIIVVAEGTKFGWPQVKRGIASVSGPALGVARLPRNYALEYLFTARLFDAEEAYRFNLVNRVVPQDKLMSTAEEIAKEISANAPSAVWGMKEAVIMGADLPMRQKMQLASLIADRVRTTEDAREGLRAFAEKRQPKFVGR